MLFESLWSETEEPQGLIVHPRVIERDCQLCLGRLDFLGAGGAGLWARSLAKSSAEMCRATIRSLSLGE
jgi:hypothetical protein